MTVLHALVALFTEPASMLGLYFVFALSTFSILVCAIVPELNPPQQTYPGQRENFENIMQSKFVGNVLLGMFVSVSLRRMHFTKR